MRVYDLENWVVELENALPAFSQELHHALQYIQPDAAGSLTKSRVVLEKLLGQVYTAEMGQEPRKRLLGDLLADNQFTRKIERRILSRMNSIRDMGNLGPHGEPVEPADAVRVLEDLCEVLEWYLRRDEGGRAAVIKRGPVGTASRAPGPKVFICYRAADTADVAGRIRDRLVALGVTDVFMDVESVPFGRDFREAVASAINKSDVVLVVMCPAWLGTADTRGQRPLDKEDDPVRVEIATALSRHKRVIPVLAGGAVMPAAADLPDDLRRFAFLKGKQIRPDPDFKTDMDVLVGVLRAGDQPGRTSS